MSNLVERVTQVVKENIVPESIFEVMYWASHIICVKTQYHQTCAFGIQVIFFSGYEYLQNSLTLESFTYISLKRAAKNFAGSISKALDVPQEYATWIKPIIKMSPKVGMNLYKAETIDNSTAIKYGTNYVLEFLIGKNPYPHEEGFENDILVYEVALYLVYDVVSNKDIQKNVQEFFFAEKLAENISQKSDGSDLDIYNSFFQCINIAAYEGIHSCSLIEIY